MTGWNCYNGPRVIKLLTYPPLTSDVCVYLEPGKLSHRNIVNTFTKLSSKAWVTSTAERVHTIHTSSIATTHSDAVINLITIRTSEARLDTLCAVCSLKVLSTEHGHTQIHCYKSEYSRVVLSSRCLFHC